MCNVKNICGNNLYELRTNRGMTQDEVCKELENYGCFIKRCTYSKYETGARSLSCDMLIVLAKFFETSSDYILGISETKRTQRVDR